MVFTNTKVFSLQCRKYFVLTFKIYFFISIRRFEIGIKPLAIPFRVLVEHLQVYKFCNIFSP